MQVFGFNNVEKVYNSENGMECNATGGNGMEQGDGLEYNEI